MSCVDCGYLGESDDAPIVLREWRHSDEEVFWMRVPRTILLCDEHWQRRDNAEPPDPDGEAFRGNECAAYQAEQMHQAQRLK